MSKVKPTSSSTEGTKQADEYSPLNPVTSILENEREGKTSKEQEQKIHGKENDSGMFPSSLVVLTLSLKF